MLLACTASVYISALEFLKINFFKYYSRAIKSTTITLSSAKHISPKARIASRSSIRACCTSCWAIKALSSTDIITKIEILV